MNITMITMSKYGQDAILCLTKDGYLKKITLNTLRVGLIGYLCLYCLKAYQKKYKNVFVEHLVSHRGPEMCIKCKVLKHEMPQTCIYLICTQIQLKDTAELRLHKVSCAWKCVVCSEVFTTSAKLKKHKITHM